ncbi:ATP-binding protein [Actinomadura macra]|uniref:ATP-binding protein n=1 Tax=Actinomadura macra TaxID=46164 RepID=UPI0012FCE6D7|nr:ATP-binding protein [Actinomadura macra]
MRPAGHPGLDDRVTAGSEVVGNASAHTASGDGGRVTVTLLTGGGLYRLAAADDGAGGRRPYVKAEDGAEGGRGMRIVEALSRRWGFRADGYRTVVRECRFGNSSGNSDRGLSPKPPKLVPTARKKENR